MTALTSASGAGLAGPERQPAGVAGLSWVTWRQHRATLTGLAVFAGLIAAYMLSEGLKVHHLYNSAVRDGCVNPTIWMGPCRPLLSPFYVGWPLSYGDELGLLLPLFAIAVGMFLGAPLLAREYTSGTTRFAWTQGTGRARLTVTKIVLLGLGVMAVAALLGWLGQWSMQPVIALSAGEFDRWQPGLFTTTPVTEAAAAALAFAVGVLASAVIRHAVPAMAATTVATIVVAELCYHRLHLWLLSVGLHQGPDQAMAGAPNVGPSGNLYDLHEASGGRWLDQGWYAGPGGHRLSGTLDGKLKFNPGLQARLHTTFQVTWQPGGRYWPFQFAQGGAEVVLAVVLAALAIWLVQRRRA
ncbi:MAG TPA: hypothetical protein VGG50_00170 [Streptosporangiaceae bacterium]